MQLFMSRRRFAIRFINPLPNPWELERKGRLPAAARS